MHPLALEILKKHWGYEQFRPAQEPIQSLREKTP